MAFIIASGAATLSTGNHYKEEEIQKAIAKAIVNAHVDFGNRCKIMEDETRKQIKDSFSSGHTPVPSFKYDNFKVHHTVTVVDNNSITVIIAVVVSADVTYSAF